MSKGGLGAAWGGGRRLLPLAVATLLLLAGLFCAWQAWLIADQGRALAQAHRARDRAAQALAAIVADERAEVARALAGADLAEVQSDPAGAAAALMRRLPQVLQLEFYSGSLNEVLHANYRQFGYAKAAQLMDAQDASGVPPMQTVFHGAHGRRLSLVLPVGPPGRPLAWAWVELPFTPLERRFDAVPVDNGRLVLQQDGDGGPLQLRSHGGGAGELEAIARRIPGSMLSVAAARPGAYIVLPHSSALAALLALLGLGGGAYLAWWRVHPRRRPTTELKETMLADAIENKPARGAADTQDALSAKPAARPAAASVTVDPSIFRAYDVRGVVGRTLTAQVARLLGQSIGTVMREKGLGEIVVGRDGRLSGPELAGALADGLREAGIDVIDVGAAPTPVIYYAAYRFEAGSCVAVTGSHNPPDYNGFKIVVGGETLSEGAIKDLHRRIAEGALASGGQGGLRHVDVLPDYVERIASDVQTERRLKVVVDAGNGIAGAVGPQVLEGIGCEVVPLYCEVDGTFPNHHPDPSDPHNLEDLIFAVKQIDADLGVAFDGDGDRLGVVTKQGEIIFPDRLLMLFARDVLSRQPGATIIYDVKCTGHLKGQVLDAGGSPLMWRTGHSLIKAKMRETGAELAGEMSGHFFFKERWYGFDDGIYAGARLLEILAGDAEGRTPEAIFATLPKGVSTPELKIELAEGEHYRFIERFQRQATFGDATLTTIDGVRADWPDGWGLVRASNTTPVLVLRFDADDEAALKRIQQVFREQLLAVDAGLKLPF